MPVLRARGAAAERYARGPHASRVAVAGTSSREKRHYFPPTLNESLPITLGVNRT